MSENFTLPVSVTMCRSTIGTVPSNSVLPEPLEVRRAQVEESAELASLLGGAYPDEIWEPIATRQEMFFDETVKAPMVVASESQILATASLQIRSDAPECGWIRWVATKPERRRQGLAQSLVNTLIAIASDAGCREIRLNTTTDLAGAIAMYLKSGFEPLVRSDEEQCTWDRVFSEIRSA